MPPRKARRSAARRRRSGGRNARTNRRPGPESSGEFTARALRISVPPPIASATAPSIIHTVIQPSLAPVAGPRARPRRARSRPSRPVPSPGTAVNELACSIVVRMKRRFSTGTVVQDGGGHGSRSEERGTRSEEEERGGKERGGGGRNGGGLLRSLPRIPSTPSSVSSRGYLVKYFVVQSQPPSAGAPAPTWRCSTTQRHCPRGSAGSR